MMTIEEMRIALKDRNLAVVAVEAGIPYPRLVRFANGKTREPSYKVVTAVERYLLGKGNVHA